MDNQNQVLVGQTSQGTSSTWHGHKRGMFILLLFVIAAIVLLLLPGNTSSTSADMKLEEIHAVLTDGRFDTGQERAIFETEFIATINDEAMTDSERFSLIESLSSITSFVEESVFASGFTPLEPVVKTQTESGASAYIYTHRFERDDVIYFFSLGLSETEEGDWILYRVNLSDRRLDEQELRNLESTDIGTDLINDLLNDDLDSFLEGL